LEAFMNGMLSGDESRAVRLHLASCVRCTSNLSLSQRIEILPALDESIELSEDFASRFDARLQERRGHQAFSKQQDPWWRRISGWRRPWPLAAAGVLVALVAVGIFLGRHPGDTTDQPVYFNDIAIAESLPLLKDMAVITNLDFLEGFDMIENLPPLNGRGATN
jgi:anti-sigma factor RsiW